MDLDPYRRKRDFSQTPEPEGRTSSSRNGRIFAIQKHAARRLHYDLRLELNGVLKSWAIPKGPSLDPKDKRLATQVEDHPLDYADFEGVIPENQYGAGTVLLWDYGQWEPQGDPQRDYEAGELKFRIRGHKLKGGWVLVRMNKPVQPEKNEWLLIKHRDAEAVAGDAGKILDDQPASVLTGRRIEQIAADRDRIWQDGRSMAVGTGKGDAPRAQAPPHPSVMVDPASVEGARPAAQPDTFDPQLARLADSPPGGAGWLHEIKYDGYRLLCFKQGSRVRLLTRRGQDWTQRFTEIAREAADLPIEEAVLDGEAVVQRANGTMDFQALQNHLKGEKSGTLLYYVFDLPFYSGYDLTGAPLDQRKQVLKQILQQRRRSSLIRPGSEIYGQGPTVYERACELGAEGIVSKKVDARYEPGRSADWLKIKCTPRQEFVIGGYGFSESAHAGMRSLLVGYYEPGGSLVYAGKVGTGFSHQDRRELKDKLDALGQDRPAFSNPPRERNLRWAEPQLVAEIVFSEWTRDMLLRQPVFKGLREDKPAEQVRLETAPDQIPAQAAGTASSVQAPRSETGGLTGDVTAVSGPGQSSGMRIAGIRPTHPDRIFYPQSHLSKADLVRYYEQIGDRILPYIANRPLTLVRCPEGIDNECFYQKHIHETLPESLKGVRIREDEKESTYIYIEDMAGLIGLVQIGALEIHPWGSRIDNLEKPDTLIFDLDPDPDLDWEHVIYAAWHLRGMLQANGLTSFVKTSGGKGLHVQVPIDPHLDWDDLKEFSRGIADAMASDQPRHYTINPRKESRRGKVFIDYLRNARGATTIAPYCPRSRPGAPVSMPLKWFDLSHRLGPDHFRIDHTRKPLEMQHSDAWEGYFDARSKNTIK